MRYRPNTRRGTWAGSCIDGPERGKFREEDFPYFRVSIAPRLSVFDFNPRHPYLREPVDIPIIEYRWSNSLEQWCVYGR